MIGREQWVLVVSRTGACPPDVLRSLRGRRHLAVRPEQISDFARDFCTLAVIDLGDDVHDAEAHLRKLFGLRQIRIVETCPPFPVPRETAILTRPFTPDAFVATEAGIPLFTDCASTMRLETARSAAEEAKDALREVFGRVTAKSAIETKVVAHAAQSVVQSLGDLVHDRAALAIWLRDVRRHHEATFSHSLLVTANAVLFGLHLGFSRNDLELVATSGLLHDIGKGIVPIAILDKPAGLTEAERETVRDHPVVGEKLLREGCANIDPRILAAVRHHHEYLDGSGYPDGLSGARIDDLTRIVTIADVFTALVEVRAYKKAMNAQAAAGILADMAGAGKLDPALVTAFRAMIDKSWREVGSHVDIDAGTGLRERHCAL